MNRLVAGNGRKQLLPFLCHKLFDCCLIIFERFIAFPIKFEGLSDSFENFLLPFIKKIYKERY